MIDTNKRREEEQGSDGAVLFLKAVYGRTNH